MKTLSGQISLERIKPSNVYTAECQLHRAVSLLSSPNCRQASVGIYRTVCLVTSSWHCQLISLGYFCQRVPRLPFVLYPCWTLLQMKHPTLSLLRWDLSLCTHLTLCVYTCVCLCPLLSPPLLLFICLSTSGFVCLPAPISPRQSGTKNTTRTAGDEVLCHVWVLFQHEIWKICLAKDSLQFMRKPSLFGRRLIYGSTKCLKSWSVKHNPSLLKPVTSVSCCFVCCWNFRQKLNTKTVFTNGRQ